MKKANILDISKIVDILEETYSREVLKGIEGLLSARIKLDFDNCLLLSDDNDIVIFFERLGNFKCQVHVYTREKCRGRKVKSFFKECIRYMIEKYNYTLFLTFIPEGLVAAEMAARVVGFKKVATMQEAGGILGEDLYMLTKSNFLEKEK